ncbi:hypothetical protein [Rhizobium laguerreae]|uniref:hypothetical protein n=1 Tax=Rhizobium laguerreae TaxID=1076926 RepID=UPI001C8FBB20|nr:hypothetical protein [Rhizobium laguerreae]MBY3198793.1 hypothetical protein [Rhizobium laguerreae]MBY3557135.1 hypothetical protein [Rhizobium laguerreae]
MRLSIEYDGAEFEDALDLIHSGQLFKALPSVVSAAKLVRKRQQVTRAPAASRPQDYEKNLRNIIQSIPADQQKAVYDFVRRLQDGGFFSSTAALRSFLVSHGMSVPQKLPSRQAVGVKVALHLAMVDDFHRGEFIKDAQSAPQESSLKRWSDLIVKGDREG